MEKGERLLQGKGKKSRCNHMGFLTHPHPTYQKGLPHPSLTRGKHIMVILALGTQKAHRGPS